MKPGVVRALRGSLRVSDPPWLELGKIGSLAFIVVGSGLIFAWHIAFVNDAENLDVDRYTSTPSLMGVDDDNFQRFFYFFYYTGQYPISSTVGRRKLVEDREAALAMLEPGAKSGLVQEVAAAVRKGDFGQLFLFYPSAWLEGEALTATPQTFNRALALVSVLALFISLSLVRRRMLAVVLVALVGSHPFALVQLYQEREIWAYSIASGSIMLALCAPLLFSQRSLRLHYLIPLVAGLFLATAREVRTEPAAMILSVALVCAFAPGGWRRRGELVAILATSFLVTSTLWSHYWDVRFEESYRTVEAAGGSPFGGLRNQHHALWHPIWCGLADFGSDRGYRWEDRHAYRYALPIVNERHGTDYQLLTEDSYLLANRVPESPAYRMKPELLPEYGPVLRDKVVGEISEDPIWYLGILGQRVQRILTRVVPARVGWGASYLEIPFSGWLFLPVLGVAFAVRRWDQVKLLLFYTPASLAAFAIFSGWGQVNQTTFHLVTLAVLTCWLVNGATTLVHRELGKRGKAVGSDSDLIRG